MATESPNPFGFSDPVRRIDLLAGRRDELAESRYYVEQNRGGSSYSIALIGRRAAGKTSLLNALEEIATGQKLLVGQLRLDSAIVADDLRFFAEVFEVLMRRAAKLGMFGGEGGAPYDKFMAQIQLCDVEPDPCNEPLAFGRIYAHAHAHPNGRPTEYSRATLRADFQVLLEAAASVGCTGIALLVDEADLLAERGELLQVVRNLLTDVPGLMVIAAGSEQMFPALTEVFSPTPRTFVRINVANFAARASTAELIANRLKAVGAEWAMPSNDTLDEIHVLTRGNPYEIVLVSHFVFRQTVTADGDAPMRITTAALDDVAGQLVAQNPERAARIAVLKDLEQETARLLSELLELDGVNAATFALAEVGLEHFTPQSFAAAQRAFVDSVNSLAHTGLLTLVDDQLTVQAEPFDRLFLKYTQLSRQRTHRVTVIRDPRTMLTNQLMRMARLSTRVDNEDEHAVIGVGLPMSARARGAELVALLRLWKPDALGAEVSEYTVRVDLPVRSPYSSRLVFWTRPTSGIDLVARLTAFKELVETRFAAAGLRLGMPEPATVDCDHWSQALADVPTSPAPVDVLEDLREAFLDGKPVNGAVTERADALLASGQPIVGEMNAWGEANDLAFMLFSCGEDERFEKLSDRALYVFPSDPLTLLTRALWLAAHGRVDEALDTAEKAQRSMHGSDEVSTMYSPGLLVRGETRPRVAEDLLRGVNLRELARAYSAAFSAYKRGASIAEAIKAIPLKEEW